jgi:hypothetical protein
VFKLKSRPVDQAKLVSVLDSLLPRTPLREPGLLIEFPHEVLGSSRIILTTVYTLNMGRGRGGSGSYGWDDTDSSSGVTSDDLAWDADPLVKGQMASQIIFAILNCCLLFWLWRANTRKRIADGYKAPFRLLALSLVLLISGYILDAVAIRYRSVSFWTWSWDGE